MRVLTFRLAMLAVALLQALVNPLGRALVRVGKRLDLWESRAAFGWLIASAEAKAAKNGYCRKAKG